MLAKSSSKLWVVIVLIVASVSNTARADQIYVTIEGVRQGILRGDSRVAGKIDVTKFAFQVTVPVSMPTGQVIGKRVYAPLRITKRVGGASAQLLQALLSNETLKAVTLDFVTVGPKGTPQLTHSMLLQNARVIGIERYAEPDAAGGIRAVEDVSIAYTYIQDRDAIGQIVAVDDFRKPAP